MWLNGPFGGGKTTAALQLQSVLPGSRVFDPELVGYMLMEGLPDLMGDNFQDLPSWRPLVAATLAEVSRQTRQLMIAPQSVLDAGYFEEITGGLASSGLATFLVVLDAPDEVLRRRIESSDEAQPWRLRQLPTYLEARDWMLDRADLVVDTGINSPSEVAQVIRAALLERGHAAFV